MACCEANANGRPCQCHLQGDPCGPVDYEATESTRNSCEPKACRETYASEHLAKIINDKRRELRELQQLLDSMPPILPHGANRAFTRLIRGMP